MKREVRFEIEATEDKHYGKADVSATFEGTQFHFRVETDEEVEFWVERDELVALLKATDDMPTDNPKDHAIYISPVSDQDAERWLRAHKGFVVSIKVRRKSGIYETRKFEVYSIKEGVVFAWQRDHNHAERFTLGSIDELWATSQGFDPRYDIEL